MRYFRDEGVPMIRGSNVTDDLRRFVADEFAFLDRDYAVRFRAQRVRAGDLVFTCWGTVGQVGIIPAGGPFDEYIISNKQLKLRVDRERVDPLFLYYYVASPEGVAYFRSVAIGSAIPGINLGILKAVQVAVPPLELQRRIVATLAAYDDLIDLNERRIRLLEESTRVLYCEWFERLRFPGHQRVAVRDGVPEGWRECRLGDVARVNDRTLSPRSAPARIGYIDISSVSPGRVDAVTEMPFAEAPSRARRLVADGDILWSTVRPERRSYALLTDPAPNTVASTGFAVITPTTVPPAWLYCAVTRDAFVAYLASIARGTSYPAVTGTDFPPIRMVVPDAETLAAFDAAAAPTFRQIHTLNLQSRAAARARDVLLPRLMDGTLPPPDVAVVEAVG